MIGRFGLPRSVLPREPVRMRAPLPLLLLSLSPLGIGACSDRLPPEGDESPRVMALSSEPDIVVNECASGSGGWIELVNSTSLPIDLVRDPSHCWYVDDTAGGGAPKLVTDTNVNHAPDSTTCAAAAKGPNCAIVAAGEHVWVPYAYINWTSPDECRFLSTTKTNSACGIDYSAVAVGGATASTVAGQCFGRLPDQGTWSSANIACTRGTANPCQSGAACDDGNPCTTGEAFSADCSCAGGSPLSGTTCGENMICELGTCVIQPAPPSHAVLTRVGLPGRILLSGTVVTADSFFDGQVLVEGDTITCVAPGDACSDMPGALNATVIETAGVISPGMVDTHNHVLFDLFDENDWTPLMTYQNHNQWTTEARYQAMLDVKQCLANDSQGKPGWCANTPYGTAAGSLRCEMDKYGELKGLVAGTTSIVGLAGNSGACFGSLARSVDVAQNGLGIDKVQTSALFPPSRSSADGVCANFSSGKTNAYLIHCGEGVDAPTLAEFGILGSVTTNDFCLYAPQTTITHGIAFTAHEFNIMALAGMKLTWSPASNVYLHGQTADIPTALAAGVLVALAPDWSIGGSQNLLDEMRFADAWDNSHWNDRLAPKDLFQMATINGAKVLALDDRLGQLKTGMLADIAVFAGDRTMPYEAILAARPQNVTLVMVGGTVLYGDLALKDAAPALPGCETLDICGEQKFLCAATTATTSKLNQTYAEIAATLSQAMLDVDAQTPDDGYTFAPITPLVRCGP